MQAGWAFQASTPPVSATNTTTSVREELLARPRKQLIGKSFGNLSPARLIKVDTANQQRLREIA